MEHQEVCPMPNSWEDVVKARLVPCPELGHQLCFTSGPVQGGPFSLLSELRTRNPRQGTRDSERLGDWPGSQVVCGGLGTDLGPSDAPLPMLAFLCCPGLWGL